MDPALLSLYESVYDSVAAAEPRYPKLVDLSGVFDGDPELVWIDDMHTSERNLVVARKITEFVNAPRGSGQPLEGEER